MSQDQHTKPSCCHTVLKPCLNCWSSWWQYSLNSDCTIRWEAARRRCACSKLRIKRYSPLLTSRSNLAYQPRLPCLQLFTSDCEDCYTQTICDNIRCICHNASQRSSEDVHDGMKQTSMILCLSSFLSTHLSHL